MTKRKHRSFAEWRILVNQQADSGLNGASFCEQQGLSCKTFYRWRKALAEKSTDSVTSQFIKVQAVPDRTVTLQPGAVLHYRDSHLSVPAGVEPVWIAELMKALS